MLSYAKTCKNLEIRGVSRFFFLDQPPPPFLSYLKKAFIEKTQKSPGYPLMEIFMNQNFR